MASKPPPRNHRHTAKIRKTMSVERAAGKAKQKLIKDAPVFARNDPTGAVNFPPYEATNDSVANEHQKFQIYPAGHIADFPRHIPYASDKTGSLSKAGRDSFEVYQYTFRIPGKDKDWTVMWDYNIGLVRVTPFFKCLNHAKTVPGKVLQENIGLKNISYSITGGALAAQGYWVPFEAAKAIAATFCHEIRFALTPVFGEDFPLRCTSPEDPLFGRMLVNQAVIDRCTVETRSWHLDTRRSRVSSKTRGSHAVLTSTPPTPVLEPPAKTLRSRTVKIYNDDNKIMSDKGDESGDQQTTSQTVVTSSFTSVKGFVTPAGRSNSIRPPILHPMNVPTSGIIPERYPCLIASSSRDPDKGWSRNLKKRRIIESDDEDNSSSVSRPQTMSWYGSDDDEDNAITSSLVPVNKRMQAIDEEEDGAYAYMPGPAAKKMRTSRNGGVEPSSGSIMSAKSGIYKSQGNNRAASIFKSIAGSASTTEGESHAASTSFSQATATSFVARPTTLGVSTINNDNCGTSTSNPAKALYSYKPATMMTNDSEQKTDDGALSIEQAVSFASFAEIRAVYQAAYHLLELSIAT